MPADDRVKCGGCGREVVPQLVVEDRSMLYHRRLMHLCPFCGAILHESGGRLNRLMLAFLIFIGLLSLVMFSLLLMRGGR